MPARTSLSNPKLSRRALLGRGAGLGLGLWAFASLPGRSRAASDLRVVVVGGGLAGMTTAYRLWADGGMRASVFEAQDRVGGRVWTLRHLDGGQIAEAGGAGINSNDTGIRSLTAELGLPLVDSWQGYGTGSIVYRHAGSNFRYRRIRDALRTAGDQAWRHYRELGWPVTFRSDSRAAERWDAVSVSEWIDAHCPGGLAGRAGSYLRQTFEVEYGGPADDASAIHVIAELGGTFWGNGYDERWTIDGGNDLLLGRLEDALPAGAVRRGHALTRVAADVDGTYVCTFATPGGDLDVVADRLVLALPFTALRNVDLGDAGLSATKVQAILQLGMGTNAKLNLQFDGEPWKPARTGESYSDLVTGSTWPGASFQPGTQGLLVALNGGQAAAGLSGGAAHGTAPAAVVQTALGAVDELFPGASSGFLQGRAFLDAWTVDPWAGGSYAYYRRGQFTTIAGVEAGPEGNVYFAGEHTAGYTDRGTMNGAVISGSRVAQEVLQGLQAG